MRDTMFKNFDNRILYVLMFIVFFFLNFFTPFQGDDYTYAFNFVDKTRIKDLIDVIESQYVHYNVANGRTIPHLLEQTFAGITGKWAFDIFNSLMLVSLISLITNKLVKSNEALKQSALLVINATIFASFYLFSFPGQSIFWMAGGLNYLLPTVLAIVIINCFKSEKEYNRIGLFFLALISGWCQEAISIPVAASLFLLFTLYKEYNNKKNAILLIGYILGTLLIVLSPGTLTRLSSGELHTSGSSLFVIVNKFLETYACLHGLYIFWISLVFIIFLLMTKKWEQFKKHKDWYILWTMNLLFFLALGFPHERITLFFSVVSFIIVADFILPLLVTNNRVIENIVLMIFIALNCAGGLYALNSIYGYKQINDKLLKSIKISPSNHVVLPIEETAVPSRFIYPLALNNDFHTGSNSNMAAYLGKFSIQFLEPKKYRTVMEILQPEFKDRIDSSFVSMPRGLNLYVSNQMHYLKLDAEYFYEPLVAEATHFINNSNLKKHQKIIRSILNSLDDGKTPLSPFVILKSEEECYCFIPNISEKEVSLELKSKKDKSVICTFERLK